VVVKGAVGLEHLVVLKYAVGLNCKILDVWEAWTGSVIRPAARPV